MTRCMSRGIPRTSDRDLGRLTDVTDSEDAVVKVSVSSASQAAEAGKLMSRVGYCSVSYNDHLH